tara:strand:- start:3468 stop:4265 length:798 start_codon:yes stop_codon:yes gene_type:complete
MATIQLGKIKQVWRGTWTASPSPAYSVDDLVAYTDTVGGLQNTSTYIAVSTPGSNASASGGSIHSAWNLVAQGVPDRLPSQSGNSGKFLKTDGSSLSFDQAGKILNIYQNQKTGKQVISNSAWTDVTGMSLSITPQLSNSKFLIRVMGYGSARDSVYMMGNKLVKVVGGSTTDCGAISGSDGSRFGSHCTLGTSNASYSGNPVYAIAFEVYHQVSSTDTIIFKVQSKQGYSGNHNIYWNVGQYMYDTNSSTVGVSTSTITAIEYT